MEKEYIVKTLNRIKEYQVKNDELAKLGIDTSEYYDGVINLLEESIALLTSDTHKRFEANLELIQWWIYEGVNKIFYYDDKPDLDINSAEDFADFLLNEK